MNNTNDSLDCSGCRISMFCHRRDPNAPQETNLKAVAVAFGIPLVACIAILIICQNYNQDEGLTAIGTLAFLAVYYFVLWLIKPHFKNC